MINVEVSKNPGESAMSVIRRFSRKVQGSGVIQRKRSLRFSTRTQSPYKVKQHTLSQLKRRAALNQLIKLGKAPVRSPRGQK